MSNKSAPRVWASCLFLAFLVANAVAYTGGRPSDLSAVFGATDMPNCKGDCSTGDAAPVVECHDAIRGQPCDTARCTINEVRIAKCPTGIPGPEEKACKTHTDSTDWWRRATVYREPCTNGGGSGAVPYGDTCTFSGTGGTAGSTPCKTAACGTGPIVTIITYANRRLCGD